MKTWAAPATHMAPQQADRGVVCGVGTHGDETRVVCISRECVGWTLPTTQVIIESLVGVTFNLFTPEISLWMTSRILVWGNCIGNACNFGASSKVTIISLLLGSWINFIFPKAICNKFRGLSNTFLF